jgi:ribosomal protein L20
MGRHEKLMEAAKGFRGRAKNCITVTRPRVEKGLQYAYRCELQPCRARAADGRHILTAGVWVVQGPAGKEARLSEPVDR